MSQQLSAEKFKVLAEIDSKMLDEFREKLYTLESIMDQLKVLNRFDFEAISETLDKIKALDIKLKALNNLDMLSDDWDKLDTMEYVIQQFKDLQKQL